MVVHVSISLRSRLASVGILRKKKREPGVDKLGWYGNFDTGFEKNSFISFKIPCAGTFFYHFEEKMLEQYLDTLNVCR